jgi:hypothetical protein
MLPIPTFCEASIYTALTPAVDNPSVVLDGKYKPVLDDVVLLSEGAAAEPRTF